MLEIRNYIESDREIIRTICKDTGRKSFQKTEKKRETLCYMFMDYYLDWEPENVFVATYDGVPCGYIVCSTNKELFQQKMKEIYIPKLFKYSWVLGVFTKICASTSKKLDNLFNGGGFHINIDDKHQGLKIGPKLLTTLGRHLKDKGHKYIYLVTQNRKTRGYGFYRHFGFEEAKKMAGGTLALTFDLDKVEEKEQKLGLNVKNK